MKRLILLIVLAAATLLMGADGAYRLIRPTTLTTPIYVNDSLDTAMIIGVTPTAGIDSFTYLCSVIVSNAADTLGDVSKDTCTISWTSPVQIMRLTPAAGDTTITVACSISYDADVVGFEFDFPETALTVAELCSRITDSINDVTGMTDSVTAEDSSTYVKIIADYAQTSYGADARWTMVLGDSLDTAGTVTTVAMVADSMAAAVNATSCADKVSGADSTTFWTIYSDDKGLAFTLTRQDTAEDANADTSLLQANVSAKLSAHTTRGLGKCIGYNTLRGKIHFVLDSFFTGMDTANDSCILALVTTHHDDTLVLVGPDTMEIPGSLYVQIFTKGDSLLWEGLQLDITVIDSMNDTNANLDYKIHPDLILK